MAPQAKQFIFIYCIVSSGRLQRLTSQISHDPGWRGACASTTRDSWGRCAVAPGSAPWFSFLNGALHPKLTRGIVDGHDGTFRNPKLFSHPRENLDLQKVVFDAADALRAIGEFATADSERDLKHQLTVDFFERAFDGNVACHAFFAERPRSATTPAGAGRAKARHVTAGVVVL